MIGPRWRKVLRDVLGNRTRTLLVVSSIFVGVLNLGLIVAAATQVLEDMQTSYEASNPSHAQIRSEPFSPDLLPSIRRMPEVAAAEGRRTLALRVKTGSDQWRSLRVTAIPDFADMRIHLLQLDKGTYPPADRQLLIERASFPHADADIGDVLEVQLGDGTIRRMPLAGVVFDDQAGPGSAVELHGYVTFETLAWLHEEQSLNRLYVTVAENADDRAHVEEVAQRVADRIRRSGRQVTLIYVPTPGQRPGSAEVIGVVQVIGFLGVLSLLLSGFLVYNILSALFVQHVRQIGMMKAIGARSAQIAGMYAVFILIISILALVPAIPLAAVGAHQMADWLSHRFNYNTLGFRIVPLAVVLQVAMGLGVAFAAGIPPILRGARISVRDAMDAYGLGQGNFGRSLIDRAVNRIRGLSRPLLISLRNTFRRKQRLLLTLTTLALGGAIFIGVFNMRFSLATFLERFNNYFLSDVNLNLERLYHVDEVEQEVTSLPGVTHVEPWAVLAGDLVGSDGTAFDTVTVFGPPSDSTLVKPVLVEGRWLAPGDENAITVNSAFRRIFPDLQVGDEIRLNLLDREIRWQVVGIFQFVGSQQLLAYVNYDYVTRALGSPNRAAQYRIVGTSHTADAQRQLARQVATHLEARGFQVSSVQIGSATAEANASILTTIVAFFLLVAILIGLVGAIGLMGTLSMNVLERTREIGVMRAVGASNRAILNMVIVEGLFIGTISWVFAALLALPISRIMTEILSRALFQTSVRFDTTFVGFLLWLLIVLVLSALAAILPARNAARLTVRDALAYE